MRVHKIFQELNCSTTQWSTKLFAHRDTHVDVGRVQVLVLNGDHCIVMIDQHFNIKTYLFLNFFQLLV